MHQYLLSFRGIQRQGSLPNHSGQWLAGTRHIIFGYVAKNIPWTCPPSPATPRVFMRPATNHGDNHETGIQEGQWDQYGNLWKRNWSLALLYLFQRAPIARKAPQALTQGQSAAQGGSGPTPALPSALLLIWCWDSPTRKNAASRRTRYRAWANSAAMIQAVTAVA